MEKKKKHHHRDGSERIKEKYLMAAKNRKRMAKIGFKMLCAVAVAIAALCFFAYYFEE